MDVVIAGGHGKVAPRLSRRLHLRGDRVRALIRKPVQMTASWRPARSRWSATSSRSTTTSLPRRSPAPTPSCSRPEPDPAAGRAQMAVDYGGAVKLVRAAQADGIERYVMLSSRGADPEAPGDNVRRVPAREGKG